MKKSILIFIILLFSIGLSIIIYNKPAFAHATLEKTIPQTNGVIKDKPEKIELKFNEPVYAKYSGITLYDDNGNKISNINPDTSGASATLSFSPDGIEKGTNIVEWHAMSADGHEVGDKFQFSVGKVTAGNIATSESFYKKVEFWFGITRYISQGAIIGFIGLFWMNEFAHRRKLCIYQVIPEQKGITGILAMITVLPLIVYLMTLTSDILNEILTFNIDTITNFPFLLTYGIIIILLAFMMIPQMVRSWYIIISIIIILVLSMSGHVWSQSIPLWSIIIRFIHLIGITLWIGALVYLCCYVLKGRNNSIISIRNIIFKINTSAVIMIIVSGILMTIDETEVLSILRDIQTWSVLLIAKVFLTILMMCLGFYQSTIALKKNSRLNKKLLFIELGFGIMLIAIGVVMSQINLPN